MRAVSSIRTREAMPHIVALSPFFPGSTSNKDKQDRERGAFSLPCELDHRPTPFLYSVRVIYDFVFLFFPLRLGRISSSSFFITMVFPILS